MSKKKGEAGYAVGLDLGTTGAKAGLIDGSGAVLETAMVPYETAAPGPGWAEQDPEQWWGASVQAISRLLSSSGVEAGSVSGVGLSGQMHGSVFLDSDLSVIRPCILWCDQRAAPQCRQITDSVGTEHLADWVSNRALAGFTAPKVLWLRENEPANYARVRALLLPKDYVNLRMTGNLSTDASDASGTLLFDVRRRAWSGRMLDALQIPREWLPPVYESSDVVGAVTAEAAGATGLEAGTPVAAGGADNACGALGMGVVAPGDVAVSIGSSGTVLAPTGKPAVDREMALHSFCHAMPGTWYMMGVMLSAGLSLRWFRDQLGEPERTLAERRGADPYRLLDETAAGAPPGCCGLIFLPYLTGERTPHVDPNAKGVLFGLDLTKTRAHVVRSIMEGVVFGLNDSVRIMRQLEIPLERVVAAGGGSRSALWLQIQADVFELPVRVAGESNAAMLGAALLGAVAGGAFSGVEEACRAAVSHGEPVKPDGRNEAAYHEAYGLFTSLYPALKGLF
ncbi:MAG: xylulokinase [Actinobacteria bacterium]|nr:xylulokinase [Actinomycetota bacterium]